MATQLDNKHDGFAQHLLIERIEKLFPVIERYALDGAAPDGYNIMRAVQDGLIITKEGCLVCAPYRSADWYPILRAARSGRYTVRSIDIE